MASKRVSYAVWDGNREEFITPICGSMIELEVFLEDIDNDTDEDDLEIMEVVPSVFHLVKRGWVVE